MMIPAPPLEDYRRMQTRNLEALSHALAGMREARVRNPLCGESWQGPHVHDLGLRDIVDILLRVKAQAYSIEAATPRHSHEWRVWEDVKLPEGKVLIPGVIAHTTAVVEHPETVAERIMNFARVLGRERVMAGADCGFAQGALYQRQHPTVMWVQFAALAHGPASDRRGGIPGLVRAREARGLRAGVLGAPTLSRRGTRTRFLCPRPGRGPARRAGAWCRCPHAGSAALAATEHRPDRRRASRRGGGARPPRVT